MIRVFRGVAPNILQTKAKTWTQNLLNLKKSLISHEKDSIEWVRLKEEYKRIENKYQHDTIKNALKNKDMFAGKCAYCESYILHIDYGHIEHYKPKSVFPEYTFDWDNLLLACGVCNGKQFKGDKFPLIEDDKTSAFINPCNDEPSDHFNFDYDINTSLAGVYGTTSRGKITEEVLGLNRPELLVYRSKYVKKIVFLGVKASQGDNEAKRLLDDACNTQEPFSAFAVMIRKQFC